MTDIQFLSFRFSHVRQAIACGWLQINCGWNLYWVFSVEFLEKVESLPAVTYNVSYTILIRITFHTNQHILLKCSVKNIIFFQWYFLPSLHALKATITLSIVSWMLNEEQIGPSKLFFVLNANKYNELFFLRNLF